MVERSQPYAHTLSTGWEKTDRYKNAAENFFGGVFYASSGSFSGWKISLKIALTKGPTKKICRQYANGKHFAAVVIQRVN